MAWSFQNALSSRRQYLKGRHRSSLYEGAVVLGPQENIVKRINTMRWIVLGLVALGTMGFAQAPSDGPYKVVKTIKVGGNGGWDY